MHIPPHFDEPRIEVMHALIRAQPLATLITLSNGALEANHIPLHLATDAEPYGTLRGHVARANPMWRSLGDGESLAIFHGPNAYVSPSWYPSKQAHGKVVPTWNYLAVHARGRLRVIDDPVWIRAQIEALTAQQEAGFAEPWSVQDAPEEFIARMVEGIIGIELVISGMQGKWKASQNQPEQNRTGVIKGLQAGGDAAAQQLAALMSADLDAARSG